MMRNLSKEIIVIAGFLVITQTFFIMKGHEEYKEGPTIESEDRRLIQEFLGSDSNRIMLSKSRGIAKTGIFGEDYFIGEFDKKDRPLNGEFTFLSKEMKVTIKPHPDQEKAEQGFLYLQQTNVEQNTTWSAPTKWIVGKNPTLDFSQWPKTPQELSKPSDPAINQAKSLDEKEVREQIQDRFLQLSEKHTKENLDENIPESITRLKLGSPPLSATMLSEFGLRTTPEMEKFYNRLEEQIDKERGASGTITNPSRYGNCKEFAYQTAKKAVQEEGLKAFVIGGRPNHVFNIVVAENQKPYLLDTWHGNLATEFNADNFYQNASLHGLFNFGIDPKLTYNSEEKGGKKIGHLDVSDPSVVKISSILTEQIEAVKRAGFEEKYSNIIASRVEKEILSLDPNDAYYLENATELQNLIKHFHLDERLKDVMKDQYIQKCDLDDFPRDHHDDVIKELFCRDAKNPDLEFQTIKDQVLLRSSPGLNPNSKEIVDYINASENWQDIQKVIGNFHQIINDPDRSEGEQIDAKSGYVKAAKSLEEINKQEFKEEKSGEVKNQDRISLKALDLAKYNEKPSPSPEKTLCTKNAKSNQRQRP